MEKIAYALFLRTKKKNKKPGAVLMFWHMELLQLTEKKKHTHLALCYISDLSFYYIMQGNTHVQNSYFKYKVQQELLQLIWKLRV